MYTSTCSPLTTTTPTCNGRLYVIVIFIENTAYVSQQVKHNRITHMLYGDVITAAKNCGSLWATEVYYVKFYPVFLNWCKCTPVYPEFI